MSAGSKKKNWKKSEQNNLLLDEVITSLKALSKGKLDTLVTGEFDSEFIEVKRHLNTTIKQLSEITSSIKKDSFIVTSKAEELASSSADLNKSAQNQASSLEQIRLSMDNINNSVRDNANKLVEATQLVSQTNDKALAGKDLSKEVVSVMREIAESSEKVQEITNVINDIAFQTNLLALNAAVEAARAGDLGRGFAVVAGEVRTLSVRSADYANEIQRLVDAAMAHIKTGQKKVQSNSQAFDDMSESIKSIHELVSSVAANSEQQAVGVNEVKEAVGHISEMTQDNAQQISSQSHATDEISKRLSDMNVTVSFFDT
ncbi:methyl-accepting chemotaxis protein [Piscirickettsia litoralis]|uniref:Methyl-accepting transducer domain-containing protein n=1 Tax=Piscirickettsia litoralis TaxID=1891921 RepID=A0ABX2ZZ94_9GAMM|nr:methyl-accepting chemotaxis protein [Piscirickettsia litoralis]ODN41921.1 hypothetical protein BGC07_01765 [Piscirickettsia litoralis]